MIKVEIKWGVAILIAVIAVTIMILVVVNELSKDADKQFLNQNVEIGVQTHPNEGDDHTEWPVSYGTFPPTSGDIVGAVAD